MLRGILSLMNVVEGEEKPVLLLLGKGFFMGIFLATYKIVATTLFLSDQELVDQLPEALFISGILGVISTSIYAWLQKRLRFRGLITFSFIAIFLFIAVVRVAFSYYEDQQRIIYAMFVMLGPITAVMILGFWGVFIRLFDLGQSKRIISRIDTGQIVAVILSTYAISLLTGIVADLSNFLIVGEISLVISLIFVIVIISTYKLTSYHHSKKKRPPETKLRNLVRNPYVVALAFFIFFSMMANTFMDFSFFNVTHNQYEDPKQLASFLAVFEGSVMVIIFLLQSFVNDALIRTFGLKTPILILPFLLLAFTIFAIFSGHIFGYEIASPQFIWFFLFITLSNLFTKTLREATENPIFKLFFMPLDKNIRFDAQARIEGTFLELSRAIGGGLILLFGSLSSFKLIHYSWFLILIVIGWIYMAYKIYAQYRNELEKILEPAGDDNGVRRGLSTIKHRVIEKIKVLLISQPLCESVMNSMILARLAPVTFIDQLSFLREKVKNENDKMCLKVIGDGAPLISYRHDSASDNSPISDKPDQASMLSIINSGTQEERIALALKIGDLGQESSLILNDFINDTDIEVVKAAVFSCGEIKEMQMLPNLIDFLHNPQLRNVASEALMEYGIVALPVIDTLFYNMDQDVDLQLRILKMYGKMGERAIETGENGDAIVSELIDILWKKLNHPNRKIVSESLTALGKCEFTANQAQSHVLRDIIESDIENLVWDFKAIVTLKEEHSSKFDGIIEAIREDINRSYNHIYLLLLMFFNKKSIQLVRENIESGTTENFSYALELLDVLFEEFDKPKELKEKIIPLLDNINDLDRLRRLYRYYPHIDISYKEIVRQIISRDLNYTNRWTKVCAIDFISSEKVFNNYQLEIKANLFNTDELIAEVAANTIFNNDEKAFMASLSRLDKRSQDHLKNIIVGQRYVGSLNLRPHMKFEMIKFLKKLSLFKKLDFATITNLVEFAEEVFFEAEMIVHHQAWDDQCIHILYEGELKLVDQDDRELASFRTGDLIGECHNHKVKCEACSFVSAEEVILLKFDQNRFYEFTTSDYEIADRLIEIS